MRWSCIAVATLIAGCAHTPIDPSKVSVLARPSPNACVAKAHSASVLLEVHNGSSRKLRITTRDERGPPYEMGWTEYAVLSGQSDPPAVYTPPMGHDIVPIGTVSLGPGDTAQFVVYIYDFPVKSRLRYRIQFQDTDGTVYFSNAFGICSLGSMPNSSFKPKPLRGSA